MGSPEFAVPTLLEMSKSGRVPVAVYTRAPARSGRRGLETRRTPVHSTANSLEFRFSRQFLARRRSPKSLQHSRSRRCGHGRLRPGTTDPYPHSTKAGLFKLTRFFVATLARLRPIQRAIMAGDLRTGIDVMRMDAGLDTGPIAMREIVPVRPDETAGDLTSRLAAIPPKLSVYALQSMEASLLEVHEQPTMGACYARKIEKSETEIDWTQTAETVRNHIHALSPAPGAFSKVVIGNKAENIKLFRAEATTGTGSPGMLLSEDMRIACGAGAIQLPPGTTLR